MRSETVEAPFLYAGSAKRTILTWLKRNPGASLADLAGTLGISRTGALKHLVRLETDGLVERFFARGKVGRPSACFRLTPTAQQIFPQGYTQAALYAISFIEHHEGREAVAQMLELRASDRVEKHRPRLAGRDLSGRVRELARIRDEEGYMAEVSGRRGSELELREYNCPILAIAERYGEACDVERRLFRDLLHAEVRVSHRVVAGDAVCRFLVSRRPRQ